MILQPFIIAGGAGSRLWPLSQKKRPKQFLQIVGDNSLLQSTIERNLVFNKNTVVITGHSHRFIAAEQLKNYTHELIIEPCARGTAPCAILAAIVGLERGVDCVALLSADTYIDCSKKYEGDIKIAANYATTHDDIVIVGITPSSPHTGYGYIKIGTSVGNKVFSVDTFVEKPNAERAEEYVISGNFLWNAGIFVFRPKVMLEAAARLQPEMTRYVQQSWNTKSKDLDFIRLDSGSYQNIKSDSVDYAIIEKASNIAVVKSNIQWSDLGDWQSLWEISKKDQDDNVVIGNVVSVGTHGCYIRSQKQQVATLNVQDLIIVSHENGVLVADRTTIQGIKRIVQNLLPQSPKEEYYRPWGFYRILDQADGYTVKKLVIHPNHSLSLQYHNHRSEYWVVHKGNGKALVNKVTHIIKEGDYIYVPQKAIHRLTNDGIVDLEIIEIQTGEYLAEEDIVRLEDIYKRN